MTTLREAAQQALEAYDKGQPMTAAAAMGRLRTALAQQAEPVAWIQPDHLQKARVAPFLCRVEPTKRMDDFVPLYTAPPAAQQAEPVAELRRLHAQREALLEAMVAAHDQLINLQPNIDVAMETLVAAIKAAEEGK